MFKPTFAIVAFVIALTGALAAPPKQAQAQPQIEVCFVLDTTGSMGGLIEGAKAKIWSIANQMIAANPRPRLRVSLIAYRDRGDQYVTRVHDLSDDLDAVYARLRDFRADGGGDTPESVNQALHEALTRVTWSAEPSVYKTIFLVGDCPPHMDYAGDVKYPETCQAAARKGIIINTVQCGNEAETTPVWRAISDLAEGRFVAIEQSGEMQVVTTPVDGELARLNREIGTTIVAYGDAPAQAMVRAKQVAAEAAPASAAADRLSYNRATGKVVQGGGDLVDEVASGAVDVSDLKKDQLPAEMQKMTVAEREAYVKDQAARRAKIQAEIDQLLAKRKAYVEEQLKAGGPKDSFDAQVESIIRAQAERKGIHYPTSPK
jgi:hypothetical protein